MVSGNLARIEILNKENYDRWKIQMEALLIKNDAWGYVNGQKSKPAASSATCGKHLSVERASSKSYPAETANASKDGRR